MTADADAHHLALVAFRMVDSYRRPLAMSADGEVLGPFGPWGRVKPDGMVTYPDSRVRGRLHSDGRLVDAEGRTLATIAADGTGRAMNIELRFGTDGELLGGDASQSIRLVEPGATAHRVAMLVFLMTQFRP